MTRSQRVVFRSSQRKYEGRRTAYKILERRINSACSQRQESARQKLIQPTFQLNEIHLVEIGEENAIIPYGFDCL